MNTERADAESLRAWDRRQRELNKCARYFRESELARIEAQHEMESDEFFTAREKAERIKQENPSRY